MKMLSRPPQNRDQSPVLPPRAPLPSEAESSASSPEHSRAPRPLHVRTPHRREKAGDSTRRGRSITRSPTAGTAGARDQQDGGESTGGLHSRRLRKERRRSRSPSRSRSATAEGEAEDEEASEEPGEGQDAPMEDVQIRSGERKTGLGGVSEGGGRRRRRTRSRQRQRYRRRSDYAYEAERKGAVEGARGMLKEEKGRVHEDEDAMDSDEEPEGRWEGVIVEGEKHSYHAGHDGVATDAGGERRRQKRFQQRGGLRDNKGGPTQEDEAGVKFKGRGSMKYREGGKRS